MPRLHASLSLGIVALGGLVLAPAPAAAEGVPLIDVYAGVTHWQPELTGDVSSDGDDFDVEGDLDFDSNSTNILHVGLEHPVPLVPNVRLRHFSMDDSASSTVTTTRQFHGVEFAADEDIRSSYDMEITDATLYYSPLDNWVSLDIGITARQLDLEVEVSERGAGGESASAGGSAVIPMGHLGVRADLPLTGFYAVGELNTISASGHRLTDARAGLGWQSDLPLGVEIGYQQMEFKLDDVDDLDADAEFGGAYAAVNLRF